MTEEAPREAVEATTKISTSINWDELYPEKVYLLVCNTADYLLFDNRQSPKGFGLVCYVSEEEARASKLKEITKLKVSTCEKTLDEALDIATAMKAGKHPVSKLLIFNGGKIVTHSIT